MSQSDVISQISEALTPLINENTELRESIEEVRAMFAREDEGWVSILGRHHLGDKKDGLDLEEIEKISEAASIQVAAGAIPKRAADLHFGFVFGNRLEIEGVERVRGKKGVVPNIVKFYENTINQESIFSGAAKHELQYARFTTGNIVVLCNMAENTVRRIPFSEVKSVMLNPEFPEEIWAYLREWNYQETGKDPQTKKVWVYTNRFTGKKAKSIPVNNEPIPVMEGTIAVDLRANRQVGFTFGVPDAAAGLHWSKAYGEVLRYGQIVNESLANVVYKVVQKTQKGASNVGVKLGRGGAGNAAVVGEGQDIQLVNSSQKSFDFAAARPLAAMAATAWNVSVVDLLSDSSAAGSSYGAGNLLTAGMQNAMNGMRDEWTKFYQDIFQVMGYDRPAINWPPMEKPDPYREAQELTLYAPALTDEEYRGAVLDRLDIVGDPAVVPPSLKARGEVKKQAASPDQGQSNDTGGQDSGQKNDQRTDTIGEYYQAFEVGSLVEEVRVLAELVRGQAPQ